MQYSELLLLRSSLAEVPLQKMSLSNGYVKRAVQSKCTTRHNCGSSDSDLTTQPSKQGGSQFCRHRSPSFFCNRSNGLVTAKFCRLIHWTNTFDFSASHGSNLKAEARTTAKVGRRPAMARFDAREAPRLLRRSAPSDGNHAQGWRTVGCSRSFTCRCTISCRQTSRRWL